MKTFLSIALVTATTLGGIAPAIAQGSTESPAADPVQLAQAEAATAIARSFIESLASGNYASALQLYDANIRTTLTPAGLESTWQDIITAHGDFQQIVSVLADENTETAVVTITCAFADGSQEMFVLFNENNQIISFDIAETEL